MTVRDVTMDDCPSCVSIRRAIGSMRHLDSGKRDIRKSSPISTANASACIICKRIRKIRQNKRTDVQSACFCIRLFVEDGAFSESVCPLHAAGNVREARNTENRPFRTDSFGARHYGSLSHRMCIRICVDSSMPSDVICS